MPVLVEDRVITDWRRNSDFSTGPLVPAVLIDALPNFAKERVLGSPLWKSIAALLGALLVALLIFKPTEAAEERKSAREVFASAWGVAVDGRLSRRALPGYDLAYRRGRAMRRSQS